MGLCPYVSLSHLEYNWADFYLILFLGAKLRYFHYKQSSTAGKQVPISYDVKILGAPQPHFNRYATSSHQNSTTEDYFLCPQLSYKSTYKYRSK